MTCKITYNLAIFSVAELVKPQARCEPVARFLVLPSDLEWLDVHAYLKIKVGDILFPASGNTNLALAVFSCLWESLIVFAKDWLYVWA